MSILKSNQSQKHLPIAPRIAVRFTFHSEPTSRPTFLQIVGLTDGSAFMSERSQEERVEHRMDIWSRWLVDRENLNGDWVMGWCPLHDRSRAELGSGEYNFQNGTFRCLNAPRCHHPKGISLSKLAEMVVKHGVS